MRFRRKNRRACTASTDSTLSEKWIHDTLSDPPTFGIVESDLLHLIKQSLESCPLAVFELAFIILLP